MGGTIAADIQLTRQRPDALTVATRLTAQKRAAFLARLELTGNISEASDAVGLSRMAVYSLRQQDPDFDAECIDVMERVTDRLEAKIRARAEDGTHKGVWYKGDRVGEEVEHHDVLAMFMLKGARPDQYRDNAAVQVNVGVSAPSVVKLSDAELEHVVAQQLRRDRCIDQTTANNYKQLAEQPKDIDNSTKYEELGKGPNSLRGGGGGIDDDSKGDPMKEQGRAKKSKSRKQSKR